MPTIQGSRTQISRFFLRERDINFEEKIKEKSNLEEDRLFELELSYLKASKDTALLL